MAKIICALLLGTAFVYAVYLVVTRRDLNKIKASLGAKNAFTLATLICAAMIMFVMAGGENPANVTCYKPANVSPENGFKAADFLKSAWLVLDNSKAESFENRLNDAVQNGFITTDVSVLLLMTYKDVAGHIYRNNSMVTCYKMSNHAMPVIGAKSEIVSQLKFLSKVKSENKLSDDVLKKIESSIAYQIEALQEFKKPLKDEDFNTLKLKYENNEMKPTENVNKAAGIIVEMEKARKKWDLTKN